MAEQVNGAVLTSARTGARGAPSGVVPLTVCVTAGPATARAVGFGELEDTLVPSSSIPSDAPMQQVLWDVQRFGVRNLPGQRAVCPHLPAAVSTDTVLIGTTATPSSIEELMDKMRAAIDAFATVQWSHGDHGRLTSLAVAVPFDDPVEGSRLVEAAHHRVKPEAIDAGCMIGEFGRALDGPGTRYTELETRRSVFTEYFAVRALLLGPDEKYMKDPASLAAYQRQLDRAAATA